MLKKIIFVFWISFLTLATSCSGGWVKNYESSPIANVRYENLSVGDYEQIKVSLIQYVQNTDAKYVLRPATPPDSLTFTIIARKKEWFLFAITDVTHSEAQIALYSTKDKSLKLSDEQLIAILTNIVENVSIDKYIYFTDTMSLVK